jgi:hypothetical protein
LLVDLLAAKAGCGRTVCFKKPRTLAVDIRHIVLVLFMLVLEIQKPSTTTRPTTIP